LLPHWTVNDLVVDGVKIHYTRTGDGSKPPLVLLHGFSDNGLCWLPVARDLEADFDVILPDARGHGHSARVLPGETAAKDQPIDMVADTAGLIRALGLNRPILGGHSMGANTSSQVGARFPDLMRALVLEDPPWRDMPLPQPPEPGAQAPARPNPMRDWITSLEKKTVDELIAGCRKDNPGWAEAELRPWAESKKQFDYNFLQRPGGMPTGWQGIAQALACPTLLITADPAKGAIVTPEIAQQVCAANANIQAVQIPGAGHNIRRENYVEYMRVLRAFLKAQA
jgi:N-formylmaleamate deformylase